MLGSGWFKPDLVSIIPNPGVQPPANMSQYNFSYTPGAMAESLHRLPHIDYKLGITSNTFRLFHADGSVDRQYISSVFIFPIIVGIFGLLAIFGLQAGLANPEGCCCCRHQKLGPEPRDPFDTSIAATALWTHKVETTRKTWKAYFLISFLLTLLACQIVFVFDGEMKISDKVVSEAMTAINAATSNIASDVIDIHDALYATELNINGTILSGTCPEAKTLVGPLMSLYQQLDGFSDSVTVTSDNAEKFKTLWHQWFTIRINWLVFGIYAIVMINLILFAVSYWFTWKDGMLGSMILAQIITIIFVFFCTAEFIALMTFGDFCMNPDLNVENALPPGQLANTAHYYATCWGENPIHQDLSYSYAVRDVLGTDMNKLYNPDFPTVGANPTPPCLLNHEVMVAYRSLQRVHTIYELVASQTSCETLHPIMAETFQLAVCINTFGGIYALWWTQAGICTGLFLLVISASVLREYFADSEEVDENGNRISYWNIHSTMEDQVKAKKEELALLRDDETDAGTLLEPDERAPDDGGVVRNNTNNNVPFANTRRGNNNV